MKFKKNLFLTFCLLFGINQTHSISLGTIKNKIHSTFDKALIEASTPRCGCETEVELILCWQLGAALGIAGLGNIFDNNKTIRTALICISSGLILFPFRDILANKYLKSKIENIVKKIKDDAELSDNEVDLFVRIFNDKYYYNYGITPYTNPKNGFDKLYEDVCLIETINHPQLKNEQGVIDALLTYIFKNEDYSSYSYESYQVLLSFVEKHGAKYVKRHMDTENLEKFSECVFHDKALAQYIEKYGTLEENSKILTSLTQDFKFRPRTIKALSKKIYGIEADIDNLKQKLVDQNIKKPNRKDLFNCDELINVFSELKDDVKQKLVNNDLKLTIDRRITNLAFFQEVNNTIVEDDITNTTQINEG